MHTRENIARAYREGATGVVIFPLRDGAIVVATMRDGSTREYR
jgi:hypothetical protein